MLAMISFRSYHYEPDYFPSYMRGGGFLMGTHAAKIIFSVNNRVLLLMVRPVMVGDCSAPALCRS